MPASPFRNVILIDARTVGRVIGGSRATQRRMVWTANAGGAPASRGTVRGGVHGVGVRRGCRRSRRRRVRYRHPCRMCTS